MKFYIGIDDTDNLESRGTGFRARQLGEMLHNEGIAILKYITRHQLYVHENIPFTSHNSSACIVIEMEPEHKAELISICRVFLLNESAPGSDAGLCIASQNDLNPEIREWGYLAKRIILKTEKAHKLAKQSLVFLEGITGTKIGVIGALAAVGLCSGGNDGRILWLPKLRETNGLFAAADLKKRIFADRIITISGDELADEAKVQITDNFVRPVLKDNLITIIVEKKQDTNDQIWHHAEKEYIKSISN